MLLSAQMSYYTVSGWEIMVRDRITCTVVISILMCLVEAFNERCLPFIVAMPPAYHYKNDGAPRAHQSPLSRIVCVRVRARVRQFNGFAICIHKPVSIDRNITIVPMTTSPCLHKEPQSEDRRWFKSTNPPGPSAVFIRQWSD